MPDRRIALVAISSLPSQNRLSELRETYDEVILLADIPDARLGLRSADLEGTIGLVLRDRTPAGDLNPLRRLLDLAVAVPAAVCFMPLMLIAGAAIWLVDPGLVIYRQAREGLRGRTVNVLKLRTMYRDADQRLEALLAADPAARAEWSTYFKLKDDPRILPIVGRILRRSSCDELPQLFNVIAGDMSIIGPRPFPEYHLSTMPAEFRERRSCVTPGLTGLWQVSARSEADIDRQRQLDEFYIDNRSFWFDLYILIRTFPAVLRRSGAY
jgi:lipopolysaccharide/colanic/teichoic acid biosynthesis glycosyltransferase